MGGGTSCGPVKQRTLGGDLLDTNIHVPREIYWYDKETDDSQSTYEGPYMVIQFPSHPYDPFMQVRVGDCLEQIKVRSCFGDHPATKEQVECFVDSYLHPEAFEENLEKEFRKRDMLVEGGGYADK